MFIVQQHKNRPHYRFIEDPSHGWLEVPLADVKRVGAEISAYSYYDKRTMLCYLEEDCDAFKFLSSAQLIEKDAEGKWQSNFDETRIYEQRTFVRDLPSIQAAIWQGDAA